MLDMIGDYIYIQGAAKKTLHLPLQKSHYFQNNLIFFAAKVHQKLLNYSENNEIFVGARGVFFSRTLPVYPGRPGWMIL